MKSIDHFTLEYEDISVTFVRIGKYLGWHGHYYKPDFQSEEYGDWITLADDPVTLDTVREGCEILGDQALRTLLAMKKGGDFDEISQFIKRKLNIKYANN